MWGDAMEIGPSLSPIDLALTDMLLVTSDPGDGSHGVSQTYVNQVSS
jgi:hypothetical protein